jgi:hypothetical protein
MIDAYPLGWYFLWAFNHLSVGDMGVDLGG